jgi:hypothetical protein
VNSTSLADQSSAMLRRSKSAAAQGTASNCDDAEVSDLTTAVEEIVSYTLKRKGAFPEQEIRACIEGRQS